MVVYSLGRLDVGFRFLYFLDGFGEGGRFSAVVRVRGFCVSWGWRFGLEEIL